MAHRTQFQRKGMLRGAGEFQPRILSLGDLFGFIKADIRSNKILSPTPRPSQRNKRVGKNHALNREIARREVQRQGLILFIAKREI